MDINNSVVAITGGGQGLGRAMAVYLAARGAKLALIDLNQEKLDETIALVVQAGSSAKSYLTNVADEAQVEAVFPQIVADMGGLDGLINNAGILRDGLMLKGKGDEISKMSLQNWQSVIDVNLTGVFLCAREAGAQMIKQGNGGCIINISSISRSGNMGQTNYSAAKSGVASMTVVWAKEMARHGVRVGAIAPGFIETEMTAGMKPEALEKMAAGIPLRRMGKPEEIAHSAQYILENDYFTGRIIECDGGLRL